MAQSVSALFSVSRGSSGLGQSGLFCGRVCDARIVFCFNYRGKNIKQLYNNQTAVSKQLLIDDYYFASSNNSCQTAVHVCKAV